MGLPSGSLPSQRQTISPCRTLPKLARAPAFPAGPRRPWRGIQSSDPCDLAMTGRNAVRSGAACRKLLPAFFIRGPLYFDVCSTNSSSVQSLQYIAKHRQFGNHAVSRRPIVYLRTRDVWVMGWKFPHCDQTGGAPCPRSAERHSFVFEGVHTLNGAGMKACNLES